MAVRVENLYLEILIPLRLSKIRQKRPRKLKFSLYPAPSSRTVEPHRMARAFEKHAVNIKPPTENGILRFQ
jgi:hypothetical protein